MKHTYFTWIILFCLVFLGFTPRQNTWISLFDGKTMNGWKVGENAATFKLEDGAIVANGPVAHLYYDGEVAGHSFRNFEFSAEVMTTPGSNSGIYFHTDYQEKSWPQKGYEVQVNNSHTDWRRTGSLWAIKDVKETFVRDNEWFTINIRVEDSTITTFINGKMIVSYTEPENIQRDKNMAGRVISRGTFALQGHDPESKVLYRKILVRLLPD